MKGQFLGLPFAIEGVRFALPLLIACGIFFPLGWKYPGLVTLALAIFVICFFRDPERIIPDIPGSVLSPADGKVVEIKTISDEPLYGKGETVRVSIFLNVFNVHINRAPVAGKIIKVAYNKGKFLNAANEKASLDNEQNAILIETDTGTRVLVKQIAGLIARRIVCWSGEGDQVSQGERFGLIRFGSRADIFLPKGSEVSVKVGDKVKGGIHVIGMLPSTQEKEKKS